VVPRYRKWEASGASHDRKRDRHHGVALGANLGLLAGRHGNYAVDREAGDAYKAIFPGIAVVARTSRAFLTRAVRYLAGETGMRQFLDIGTGLPTANNTHQVAQSVAPESRIVYVDNDPLVLAHARALLTSIPEGSCDYLDADIRNPEGILETAAGPTTRPTRS
jgi:hypothetical protein